jgi:hypothetical protein
MHAEWENDITNIKTLKDTSRIEQSFIQEMADLSLILSRLSNKDVYVELPKKVYEDNVLTSSLRVDGLADSICIKLDCNGNKISFSMLVRANTKRTMLKACFRDSFKFIEDAKDLKGVYIEAKYKGKRNNKMEPVQSVLKDVNILQFDNAKIIPDRFVLEYVVDVNKSTFKSRKSQAEFFYKTYAVNMKNWMEKIQQEK